MLLTALIGTTAVQALSQELNESMTVQGAYDPVIRKHERISPLPDRLDALRSEASLPLEVKGVAVGVNPLLDNYSAPGYNDTLPSIWRGYLDIMAGSYLTPSVSAGYRIANGPHTRLGAWLQYNSSSLFRANDNSPYRRRYDGTLGLNFSHNFLSAGTLSASASYHLGYFNYYRALTEQDIAEQNTQMPGSQALQDLQARIDWQSFRSTYGLRYTAGVSYRYFGFRRMYEVAPEGFNSLIPSRENDIDIHGRVSYQLGDEHNFSLSLKARWLPYTHTEFSVPGFYTLTPAYTLTTGSFRLHAGAKIDFASKVERAEKFSTVHAAPDVAIDYAAGKFEISLAATGGVQPVTLAGLHELAYYSLPSLSAAGTFSQMPMYTPLNARLRIGLGNLNGLNVGIWGSYASTHAAPLAGTYPLYLYGGHGIAPGNSYLLTPGFQNIHGFSAGLDLKYMLGRFLEVKADLAYTPQKGSRGAFNGLDRPRWVLATEAVVKPMEGLQIALGYDYRGVRSLYFRPEPQQPLGSLRLPDFYDLHASADYTFLQRYTVGISARNILGSNAWLTPAQPLEGCTILGRFAVLF